MSIELTVIAAAAIAFVLYLQKVWWPARQRARREIEERPPEPWEDEG